MSDAITRKEAYLKSIGDGTSLALKPITREEQYLAYIAGESKSFPTTPITREEAFLDKIAKSGAGGGSSINVQPLTVTENGTWDAPEGQAYDPVTVNVAGGGGNDDRIALRALIQNKGDTPVDLVDAEVTEIGYQALASCQPLRSINFPNATFLQYACCNGCVNLVSAYLPKVTTAYSQVFHGCYALERIEFAPTDLNSESLSYTQKLKTLILRTTKVCNLTSTGAIANSALKNGSDCYVYVPKALIEQYKVATNWSTVADQFRAIEDYPEITGG